MSVYDNLYEYNKCRQRLQDAEDGFIPINPDEDLLEAFMGRHNFSATQDQCSLNILLIDEKGQKIYTYPRGMRDMKQWVLRIMVLVVKLRNMKETYWKEKDYHKRRKIYSRMNCIKGGLNRYDMS